MWNAVAVNLKKYYPERMTFDVIQSFSEHNKRMKGEHHCDLPNAYEVKKTKLTAY